MPDPLVSTVIPAYNAAATLRQAVRSVQLQGIEDVEVIIVDDGSSDATAALAEELALGDDRVWVLGQRNAGVSAARNTGLRAARGQWVHFLDADDWMLEGGLGRLIHAAERSGLDGACGGAALHDEDGAPLAWSFGPGAGSVGVVELLERNRFQPGSALVRRARLESTEFDQSIEHAEDWDLWLRLSERGLRWAAVTDDVSAYRLRRASASRGFAKMALAMRAVLERGFERCRTNHTSVVPTAALRHERLEAALRRAALHQATAASLDDPSPEGDAAFTVLVSAWPGLSVGGRLGAAELAEAAFWMLPFADGLAPSAWSRADAGAGPRLESYAWALRTFWSRCVREGCMALAEVEEALGALAGLAVPTEEVGRALARRCAAAHGSGRGVTLLGLGQNAAHVAAGLRELGIEFDARDDSAEASFASIAGCGVEVRGADEPYNPAALHVVTLTDDSGMVARLPRGVDVVRWNDERRSLGSALLVRLRAAWGIGGSPRTLGAAA